MIDQTKNIMIGLFVIAACAIITFIVLFLHPSVGDEGKIIRVRFANIDKVNIGTRVSFAGKPVGEVVEITEIPAAISHRRGHEGYVYVYELKLVVDSRVNVFNTDSIAARTSGLLGEKSVEISPHPLMSGEKLVNITDEILYAEESGSVEEAFKEFSHIADKVGVALDTITSTLREMKDLNMWQKIASTFSTTNELVENINGKWETIDRTINDISSMAANVNTITGNVNKKWSSIDEAIDHFTTAAAQVNSITSRISNGDGSIGRLLFDDDFYLRTTSVVSKAETIMDDITHYGILFHLDKGWQRMRARRLNLLQKLCTPQEFRNFFNDEINQISTSLSRVSMILDKTSCSPSYGCLVEDHEFAKVFAELLRRVNTLEESLRMYNQQLINCEVKQTELCTYEMTR